MKNVLFISTLENKWKRVSFIKDKFLTWLIDAPMRDAFMLGLIFEGLYRVTGRPLLEFVHNTNHLSELWSQSLAHLHYDALKKLNKLVSIIPNFQSHHDGVCPGCESGKKTRGPLPSSKNKTNEILNLIHSDVCGLMPIYSVGGHPYYITFINDFSRKTWIYYLKNKDEAYQTFKEFKALIKNQSRKRIKAFRSNNGGEYMS